MGCSHMHGKSVPVHRCMPCDSYPHSCICHHKVYLQITDIRLQITKVTSIQLHIVKGNICVVRPLYIISKYIELKGPSVT